MIGNHEKAVSIWSQMTELCFGEVMEYTQCSSLHNLISSNLKDRSSF